MKTLFVLLIVFLNTNYFAQEAANLKPFSKYGFGILAGANLSNSNLGHSIFLEGKTNLFSNLSLKLSIGYSRIFSSGKENIKSFTGYDDKYQVYSFNKDKTRYSIIPMSIGIEYYFNHNKFSPYCFIESGYNSFHSTVYTSSWNYGEIYNAVDQIPAEYKINNNADKDSYNLGLGIGTTYQLSSIIDLNLRYVYQINSKITNTNMFLVGVSF